MFALINGKPIFYIGKINGVGYADKKERDEIIKELKEDDSNIEIEEEEIEINNELKEKAIELGEMQLTYSKAEFLQYLNGEKLIPELETKKLKEENKKLQNEIRDMSTINKANMLALMEINSRLNKMESDK